MITVTLMSFGFKYGLPNANYYFDVGFLKNPAREKKWDFFSNADEEMRSFIMKQKQAKEFIAKVFPLLLFLSNIDQHQIFAFGCNAGRHRSRAIVKELVNLFKQKGIMVNEYHRD